MAHSEEEVEQIWKEVTKAYCKAWRCISFGSHDEFREEIEKSKVLELLAKIEDPALTEAFEKIKDITWSQWVVARACREAGYDFGKDKMRELERPFLEFGRLMGAHEDCPWTCGVYRQEALMELVTLEEIGLEMWPKSEIEAKTELELGQIPFKKKAGVMNSAIKNLKKRDWGEVCKACTHWWFPYFPVKDENLWKEDLALRKATRKAAKEKKMADDDVERLKQNLLRLIDEMLKSSDIKPDQKAHWTAIRNQGLNDEEPDHDQEASAQCCGGSLRQGDSP